MQTFTFKMPLPPPVYHEHINGVEHRTMGTHKARVSTVKEHYSVKGVEGTDINNEIQILNLGLGSD